MGLFSVVLCVYDYCGFTFVRTCSQAFSCMIFVLFA
jgi:hypothetical protein